MGETGVAGEEKRVGDFPPFLNPRFQLDEDSLTGSPEVPNLPSVQGLSWGRGLGEEWSWDPCESINRYLPRTKQCQALCQML